MWQNQELIIEEGRVSDAQQANAQLVWLLVKHKIDDHHFCPYFKQVLIMLSVDLAEDIVIVVSHLCSSHEYSRL